MPWSLEGTRTRDWKFVQTLSASFISEQLLYSLLTLQIDFSYICFSDYGQGFLLTSHSSNMHVITSYQKTMNLNCSLLYSYPHIPGKDILIGLTQVMCSLLFQSKFYNMVAKRSHSWHCHCNEFILIICAWVSLPRRGRDPWNRVHHIQHSSYYFESVQEVLVKGKDTGTEWIQVLVTECRTPFLLQPIEPLLSVSLYYNNHLSWLWDCKLSLIILRIGAKFPWNEF